MKKNKGTRAFMENLWEIKEGIMQIYYGLWAGMLDWSPWKRAMIIVFVLLIIVKICFGIGKEILLQFITYVGTFVIKLFYFGAQNIIYIAQRNKSKNTKIVQMNRVTHMFENANMKLEKIKERLNKFRGGNFRIYCICYVICIFFIAFPDITKGIINEIYREKLSFGKNIYCFIEEDTLIEAAKYEPFFLQAYKEDNRADYTDSDIDVAKNQWYMLSKKGRDGTNFREGPGEEYNILFSISGDIEMQYIEEKGEWVCFRLQSGEKGWIHQSLVEAKEE